MQTFFNIVLGIWLSGALVLGLIILVMAILLIKDTIMLNKDINNMER